MYYMFGMAGAERSFKVNSCPRREQATLISISVRVPANLSQYIDPIKIACFETYIHTTVECITHACAHRDMAAAFFSQNMQDRGLAIATYVTAR